MLTRRCLERSEAFYVLCRLKTSLMFRLTLTFFLRQITPLCLRMNPFSPTSLLLRIACLSKSCLFKGAFRKSITGGLCLKDMSFLIICLPKDLAVWLLGQMFSPAVCLPTMCWSDMDVLSIYFASIQYLLWEGQKGDHCETPQFKSHSF